MNNRLINQSNHLIIVTQFPLDVFQIWWTRLTHFNSLMCLIQWITDVRKTRRVRRQFGEFHKMASNANRITSTPISKFCQISGHFCQIRNVFQMIKLENLLYLFLRPWIGDLTKKTFSSCHFRHIREIRRFFLNPCRSNIKYLAKFCQIRHCFRQTAILAKFAVFKLWTVR